MTKSIVIPDPEYLPPELLLDPYHPASQKYMQDLNAVKRLIVTATVDMIPWHVTAVKAKVRGSTNIAVADIVGKTAQSVSHIMRRDDVKNLRALLQHYNIAVDGPNDAQRRRMLWEMAVDNKEVEPNVAIKCVSELNKMNGTYTTGAKDTSINITINNSLLPKGKLDT
jgi:hypothetical protein|tara:strand:+ start:49 stop:552 length:504 start_codon:yes stop_codon:yes gene_type:complete